MLRATVVLTAVCLLAALAAAGSASAASPTLLTVGASGGYATASWSLAPGAQAWTIEVATSPALDVDGSFLSDDVVDIHVFMDSTTSWTGTQTLADGTYYVHISGASCASCADVSWSAIKSFSVGGATTTTTTDATTTSAGTTTSATTTGSSSVSTTTSATATTTTVPATTTTSATTTAATATTAATTTTTAPTATTTTAAPAGASAPPPPPQFTIPYTSLRPRVAALAFARTTRTLQATLKACDRSAGRLVLHSVARRGRAVRSARSHLVAGSGGCWPYLVSIPVPRGSGPVTVTLRLRDAAGAWSPAFSRRLGR